MPKPTSLPRWATGGAAQVTEPTEAKKDTGWAPLEKPPAQYFNWFMRLVHEWAVYLDELTNEALTWASKHTFSAGLASGVAPAAANDVVRKAELDAEASARAAADASETAARTAVDATKANDNVVVKLTGAQSIAGVKTFSSPPVVPAPVAGGDAANRAYVDSERGKSGWVVVSATGTILRSGGGLAITVTKLTTGRYRLTATNLHNGCVVAGWMDADDTGWGFGPIIVNDGVPNEMGVSVKNGQGGLIDKGFTAHAFVP